MARARLVGFIASNSGETIYEVSKLTKFCISFFCFVVFFMSSSTHVAIDSDSTPGVALDDLLDQLTIPDYVNTYGECTKLLGLFCECTECMRECA